MEPIGTETELREVYGEPLQRALDKEIDHLDRHCRTFIAHSPFLVLSSADAEGRSDVSPKGGPPGFVSVLDDHTLAMPDAKGNRRVDSFSNIVENPAVALLFMVPGIAETLRIRGRAELSRDPDLREAVPLRGKPAEVVLTVAVETAFLHCAKAFVRSSLWKPDGWPDTGDMPSSAEMLRDHRGVDLSVAEVQAGIDESIATRLW